MWDICRSYGWIAGSLDGEKWEFNEAMAEMIVLAINAVYELPEVTK